MDDLHASVDMSAIESEVARCAPIAAAWVFGSVARGGASDASDLDLAVLLDHPASPDDVDALGELSMRLERFSPSGRVDIVILGDQGPVFRHRVLREGRLVLDRDPRVRHDFEGAPFPSTSTGSRRTTSPWLPPSTASAAASREPPDDPGTTPGQAHTPR